MARSPLRYLLFERFLPTVRLSLDHWLGSISTLLNHFIRILSGMVPSSILRLQGQALLKVLPVITWALVPCIVAITGLHAEVADVRFHTTIITTKTYFYCFVIFYSNRLFNAEKVLKRTGCYSNIFLNNTIPIILSLFHNCKFVTDF